jgi:methyl-accepting chemotaxis protein
LRSLTADNPAQQRRLDALRPVIDERIGHAQRTIDAVKTSLEAATKLVTGPEVRQMNDYIRKTTAEIDADEERLLGTRARDALAASEMTKAVMLWGSLFGAIAVGLIGWFIASSLGQQISTAVHQVQSSSTELQAAANQQASGAKEQATAMNEITTTISELLATSRQIAESARRVAQIAEQTASSARTGDGTVERAHESIAAIRRQVDSIVSHMLELGRKSQQIGAVLEIVSELAEQTNILAINATIEAAGAGDAGRRFAVVADEIRKLADRVTGSTKEIRGLIEDVRSAVNTTVMATETGSKGVDAGSKQFGDVAAAFKQIGGLVQTTTDAAREIELSTKQQSTAVEQVNLAIANVAQATRETEASAEQTLNTVTQLSVMSKSLLRIVQPQIV